ncbi:hypothetical protein EUTSA_v10012174mg [Eutrema salsugineum]|uniref:Uncharacterized protein n=1 Tax=Eutrema salsugineum TaxID=72664 RepID=V4KRN6_EUTSA|nr:hypothetical protein EUTSA_v10012174mg [Eutrema salsugineum]
MGTGYLSSDSPDHQSTQTPKCNDSVAPASTPKLSSINGTKTETSSVDGSARTETSLRKHMRSCGVNRIEVAYNSNTCELIDLLSGAATGR